MSAFHLLFSIFGQAQNFGNKSLISSSSSSIFFHHHHHHHHHHYLLLLFSFFHDSLSFENGKKKEREEQDDPTESIQFMYFYFILFIVHNPQIPTSNTASLILVPFIKPKKDIEKFKGRKGNQHMYIQSTLSCVKKQFL